MVDYWSSLPEPAPGALPSLSKALGRLRCRSAGCGQELTRADLNSLHPDPEWESRLADVVMANCWSMGLIQLPKGAAVRCPACGTAGAMMAVGQLHTATFPQLKAAVSAHMLGHHNTRAACCEALLAVPPQPHCHATAPKELSAFSCAISLSSAEGCAITHVCIAEGCGARLCSSRSLLLQASSTQPLLPRGHSHGGLETPPSAALLLQSNIISLAELMQQETEQRLKRKKGSRGTGRHSVGGWASGIGFGGSYCRGSEGVPAVDRQRMAAAQVEQDRGMTAALCKMATCLKAVVGGRHNRHRPAPLTAAAAVHHGGLAPSLQILLRNDCLADIAERSELYFALLNLLGQLSAHPDLVSVIYHRPPSDPEGQSLLELMVALKSQAEVFLKLQHSSPDEVEALSLGMALEIESVYDKVERNCREHQAAAAGSEDAATGSGALSSTSGVAASGSGGPSVQDRFRAALKPLQFQMAPILNEGSYHFRAKAEACSASSGAAGQMYERNKRILKEVSSLASALPLHWDSSIHVVVDEKRFDVLRVLIFPDQATPYANGAFEFDVFLPPGYPGQPPKVHFRTTGGGRVRFNPNLYNCGKVCLSLLGTWEGPSWDPRSSTLLQVLISIQSLILVPDPYFNEPGNERHMSTLGGRQASAAYNRQIQCATLEHAVLPLLRQPPRGPFKEVIREHSRFRSADIAKCCDGWAAAEQQQEQLEGRHGGSKHIHNQHPRGTKSLKVLAGEVKKLLHHSFPAPA